MTQEEKRLLEIELATRSQYGVICAVKPVTPFHDLGFCGKQKIKNICIRENDSIFTFGPYEVHGVENIRPYLRPMSSMTAKEWLEYCDACLEDEKSFMWAGTYKFTPVTHKEEFLNAHHFDYRGLIPMGLALEAPADMYKTK